MSTTKANKMVQTLLLCLSILTGVFGTLWIFVGLWWWAILGMDADVVTATTFSILTLSSLSAFSWLGYTYFRDQS